MIVDFQATYDNFFERGGCDALDWIVREPEWPGGCMISAHAVTWPADCLLHVEFMKVCRRPVGNASPP